MKKREIIKSRYETICEIEYKLNKNCRLCPFSKDTNNSIHTECLGCPVLAELKELGEKLQEVTNEYRSSNDIKSYGEDIKVLGEQLPHDKSTARARLAENMKHQDFKKHQSKGLTYNEMGKLYQVSGNLVRVYANEMGWANKRKLNPNNNNDYITKVMGWDNYVQHIKENMMLDDICLMYSVDKPFLNKWIKQEKDLRGIQISMNKWVRLNN